jgi:hypothetical protein
MLKVVPKVLELEAFKLSEDSQPEHVRAAAPAAYCRYVTETGKNQLAVWTKTWLTRMSQLFPSAHCIPPLLLVRVVGRSWFLMFAWEELSEREQYDHGTNHGEGAVMSRKASTLGNTRSG